MKWCPKCDHELAAEQVEALPWATLPTLFEDGRPEQGRACPNCGHEMAFGWQTIPPLTPRELRRYFAKMISLTTDPKSQREQFDFVAKQTKAPLTQAFVGKPKD
jgi:ssDNA-binding Zn-finger/Zn-ribbon topoisomerase 1